MSEPDYETAFEFEGAFEDGKIAEREALLAFLAEQEAIAAQGGKIVSLRWVIDAVRDKKHWGHKA